MGACSYSYSTNLGNYCRKTSWKCKHYYQEECSEFCKAATAKDMEIFIAKEKERIKKSQIETAKKLKELRTKAEKLYWQHVDPRTIEDIELKKELIRVINSEEYANQIYD